MRSKCPNSIKILGMVITAGIYISTLMTGKVHAASVEERLQEQIAQAFENGNVYAVVQDGSGDFITIQEGVDAVASGDTLLIYPGVYEEHVEIANKTVNLLGTDKDNCILQYQSVEYNAIPLTFSAGFVANLTIYGFVENGVEEKQTLTEVSYDISSLESIREWQKNFSGYALHIDDNYTYGKEVYVENCRIVSDNSQCIGIGCRGKSEITFEDCELISNGNGGCIYFHNTDNEDLGGDAYFTMKNCELKNYLSPYVISMHCMGAQNPVYLTFQNVRTSTVAYEEKNAYNVTNMNNGFEIEMTMESVKNKRLQPLGFDLSLKEGMITYLDSKESSEYIAFLERESALMKKKVDLSEGITYLSTKSNTEELKAEEDFSEIESRKRYVIDIFNSSQLVGNGWCGLDYIYLTPESFGNTLIEMNYPITQ